MRPQIAIIDYGMGNLFSVQRACEEVGLKPVIASDKSVIMDSAALILPGVGAFGDAMDNLKKRDLISSIKKFIESGKLFMGICLGMQLLMSGSEEFGSHEGLNIISGKVVRFPPSGKTGQKIKVPQVGWNQVLLPNAEKKGLWDNSPLRDVDGGEFMYFVHSYYAVPRDHEVILSVTRYGQTEYCSSIFLENIFACQYHPEKSAQMGLKIYKNFSSMLSSGRRGS
jgi:glutamine amidotransferase